MTPLINEADPDSHFFWLHPWARQSCYSIAPTLSPLINEADPDSHFSDFTPGQDKAAIASRPPCPAPSVVLPAPEVAHAPPTYRPTPTVT
jgi:hypothetical protein